MHEYPAGQAEADEQDVALIKENSSSLQATGMAVVEAQAYPIK